MIMKLALPRASPHWISRCLVFPAMWSSLPCAPCTALVNGYSAPHWARYRHQMAKPRQVTDAPVSTSPLTGMPSMQSRPEMGGATAHPTGANLASGDPPISLNAMGGLESRHSLVVALILGRLEDASGLFLRQQALQQCAGRAAVGEVPLFIAEEAPHRPSVLAPVLAPIIWRIFLPIRRLVFLHILVHRSWRCVLRWGSHSGWSL